MCRLNREQLARLRAALEGGPAAWGWGEDQRWTLAVTFVHPQDSLLAVLQRLLSDLQALGLSRGCLYLDKAFCSVAVLGYLQAQTKFAA